MKLPLHHNIRTNKRVRKQYVFKSNKNLLSTRYENCFKCDGTGEVYYVGSSKSILSHITCHGEKIYVEQLCKDCDEVSRKYCKSCHGNGYTDFVDCDACYSSGLNSQTKSIKAKLYRSDNRRKIKKENPSYMRCWDCETRICEHVIWNNQKIHKLVKTIDYNDLNNTVDYDDFEKIID